MKLAEFPQAEEFCPSCGKFVDDLDEETGWCFECSGTQEARCLKCDSLYMKDQPHRKLCPKCRDERWLYRHADELEEYLALGVSFAVAKREVYHANRPVCIVCNQPIKGGKSIAYFCKRNIECRRWRRRYRTLREKYQIKGIANPDKIALAEVSAEIFAMGYRMEL